MSLKEPGKNDITLKAYGKLLGFFTTEEAVARIPFPVSLFKGKEQVIRFTDIQRISLMQDNEDFSVYIVTNSDANGKESRCNV